MLSYAVMRTLAHRDALAPLVLSAFLACSGSGMDGGDPPDGGLPQGGDGAEPQMPSKPKAAVALGDSFISGEAADSMGQSYLPAFLIPGTNHLVPASNVPGNYCHRSKDAAIFKAQLPQSVRFNLACSGAESKDILSANTQYKEPAQLEHLRAVTVAHHVELIFLSVGGNDLEFADYLQTCMGKFASDAVNPLGGSGCKPEDLPGQAALDIMKPRVAEAIDAIKKTLGAAGQKEGSYRIILQSYPSPLPKTYHPSWFRAPGLTDFQYDTDWAFVNLATRRFGAGCPFHQESAINFVAMAPRVSAALKEVATAQGVEFLALHDALLGYARCERENVDESAFAGMLHPDNSVWKNYLNGGGGTGLFNVLQESMHPNLSGHERLAPCLAGAAALPGEKSKICGPGGVVRPLL